MSFGICAILMYCGSEYARGKFGGRQNECGSSFEPFAVRSMTSFAAHGWYGSPSLSVRPISVWSMGRPICGMQSFSLHSGSSSAENHMPERSGLPSAARGAGAFRFGERSALRGTLAVG